MSTKQKKDDKQGLPFDVESVLNTSGLGGILGGLTGLMEKLQELSEKGEELSKTVEFNRSNAEGREVRAVYGFTIKTGIGKDGPRVEPFGNVRRDDKSGNAVVHEVREPVVDLFEEDDHVLVVAEMPGVTAEDVRLEMADDLLTLSAERGDKKYRKEILLPASFASDRMQISCNNGIVEIRCQK